MNTTKYELRTVQPALAQSPIPAGAVTPIEAEEIVLRRFAPRAISLITSPRILDDGRTAVPRLSANDCYVVLEEACRKVARVALRRYNDTASLQTMTFAQALDTIFPDPAAYLARAIRSVISDAERTARREPAALSLDQPIAGTGDNALCLGDVLADNSPESRPDQMLIDHDERTEFRTALAHALTAIPVSYREAIQRDIERENMREEGQRPPAENDKERQTICRARAALSRILQKECGPDNPFVHLLMQQRSSRVRRKQNTAQAWTGERQNELFRKLLDSSWRDRAAAAAHPEENIEEAVVNEVSLAGNSAPPSPDLRRTLRVLDTYTLNDNPLPVSETAQELFLQAGKARKAGRLEEAVRLYRAAQADEPSFLPALNEAGVLLIQMGNLRDALKLFTIILESPSAGDERYIAATNAADIHLTWFDTGRNREQNIAQAARLARLAMARPTPMRACNMLLALAKDRYYNEAKELLDTSLHAQWPGCPPEKLLQTLFQIRDADLVTWWAWLESELAKEDTPNE